MEQMTYALASGPTAERYEEVKERIARIAKDELRRHIQAMIGGILRYHNDGWRWPLDLPNITEEQPTISREDIAECANHSADFRDDREWLNSLTDKEYLAFMLQKIEPVVHRDPCDCPQDDSIRE